MLSTTAEAQVRQRTPQAQPQTQRAVPRTASPRLAPPNEWGRLSNGIRVNDRSFSLNVAYFSGSPFGINGPIPYYPLGGYYVPGRIIGDVWSPIPCLPPMLTQWDAIEAQWYNVYGSRFGPTIGEQRALRYSMAAGVPYGPGMIGAIPDGYSQQQHVVESPVNEGLASETQELREWKRQHELEDAKREGETSGYQRAREEFEKQRVQPAQSVQQQPQEQPNVFSDYRVEYIEICTEEQYDNVVTGYTNYVLNLARNRTRGTIDKVARDGGYGRLEIRDENDNSLNTIKYDELIKRKATAPEIISFLNKRFLERGIDPDYVGANVTFSSRSCRQ